jgi:hypothetical protein
MKVNDENTYPEIKKSRSSSKKSRDPLQDISIEYSNDSDNQKNEQLEESQVESQYSGLDQTIIIGDVLEETHTSIFDDLKVSKADLTESITISK